MLQVVVFGGGSFGTAMATALARQKRSLDVVMLLRDPYVCRDINMKHVNTRYLEARAQLRMQACAGVNTVQKQPLMHEGRTWLAQQWTAQEICCHQAQAAQTAALHKPASAVQAGLSSIPCMLQGFDLPVNVSATTSAAEAILHAQYAIHAVPVQHSRDFLHSITVCLGPWGACWSGTLQPCARCACWYPQQMLSHCDWCTCVLCAAEVLAPVLARPCSSATCLP